MNLKDVIGDARLEVVAKDVPPQDGWPADAKGWLLRLHANKRSMDFPYFSEDPDFEPTSNLELVVAALLDEVESGQMDFEEFCETTGQEPGTALVLHNGCVDTRDRMMVLLGEGQLLRWLSATRPEH